MQSFHIQKNKRNSEMKLEGRELQSFQDHQKNNSMDEMNLEVGTFIVTFGDERQEFDVGQVMQVKYDQEDVDNTAIFVHWYEAVQNYVNIYKEHFRPRGKFRRLNQPVASMVKYRQILVTFETLTTDGKLEERTTYDIKKAIKDAEEEARAGM